MMDDPLLRWVNQDVILGYGHADLHDCRDGQCQQGSVLAEANREGVTINRSID
jgi:hypothetical protein